MIKYCIFSIFCFLPFLIWADELPQLGKAPLEKVIQAMTVDEKIRLLTGTGGYSGDGNGRRSCRTSDFCPA